MSTQKVNRIQETTASAGVSIDDMREYGAQYNVRHVAIGAAGDGATDDRPVLNTLVNTTLAANGGTVIFPPGTYRISSALTVPKNITLRFVNGAKLSVDTGITVVIQGPVDVGLTQWISGLGTVGFSSINGRHTELCPEWFGAAGDSVNDDTAAIRACITALPTQGGVVKFGSGFYKITGDLSTAINARRHVVLRGINGYTIRGLNAPPVASSSIIYMKSLTTYLFTKSGTTNETLRFENLAFDASDGGGLVNGSTTCPGMVASNGAPMYGFTCENVSATDFLYAHSAGTSGTSGRAIFDFDPGVDPCFTNCFFGVCEAGRIFFTNTGSSVFKAKRCYFSGARECYYHRGTHSVRYSDCIFESSVVVGAQYLSNVQHAGCHYENVGADLGGTHAATGLAPRDHGMPGMAATLPGNVNTAFNITYGDLSIDGGSFQYITATSPPYSTWFECVGVGTAQGTGGSLTIRNSKKSDPSLLEFLFSTTSAFGAVERGTEFSISVEDVYGVTPSGCIVMKFDDARKITHGRCRIIMADLATFQYGDIRGGRYIINAQDPGNRLNAAPVTWPRNAQNEVGDMVYHKTPVSAGFIGSVCITAGQPGTWKTFGLIS